MQPRTSSPTFYGSRQAVPTRGDKAFLIVVTHRWRSPTDTESHASIQPLSREQTLAGTRKLSKPLPQMPGCCGTSPEDLGLGSAQFVKLSDSRSASLFFFGHAQRRNLRCDKLRRPPPCFPRRREHAMWSWETGTREPHYSLAFFFVWRAATNGNVLFSDDSIDGYIDGYTFWGHYQIMLFDHYIYYYIYLNKIYFLNISIQFFKRISLVLIHFPNLYARAAETCFNIYAFFL